MSTDDALPSSPQTPPDSGPDLAPAPPSEFQSWWIPGDRKRLWGRVLAMTLLALPVAGMFQARELQIAPYVQRARAAQWVRTTAVMLESKFGEGPYPSCGGTAQPCRKHLGWMNAIHLPAGATLSVRGGEGTFEVSARFVEGAWVQTRGQVARWEGPPEAIVTPGWMELLRPGVR